MMGHGHVITLTHLRNDAEQVTCRCGQLHEVSVPRVIGAQILAHRMQHFPLVRQRLLA